MEMPQCVALIQLIDALRMLCERRIVLQRREYSQQLANALAALYFVSHVLSGRNEREHKRQYQHQKTKQAKSEQQSRDELHERSGEY
jgi:uncharacterized membrane protein